jgi:hypothetical protein
MKRTKFILFLLVFTFHYINAQKKNFSFELGSSLGYITSGHIPFWFRSNQFGNIPVDNASMSFIGAVHKDYDYTKKQLFDWGASLETRSNLGNKSNFNVIEGFGKIRFSVFDIIAGRSKEIMGLCDTSLSSGSFAVSGNAVGIPKVEISILNFYSLPLFGKLFAFKGNYAHGWIGKTYMNMGGNDLQIKTFLHQKSFYGRFGRPGCKWKLYGGFNHQVLWGNEKESYGKSYSFSPAKTYLYVIKGGGYNNSVRIGDQLGSIDLGFEYEFKNIKLLAYRQNFYEAGALYYLANIRDGLNGLSLMNLRYRLKGFQWKKILIEVFYTKSQGGEPWSVPRPSGAEDYYNHYQYLHGWSYQGFAIGNPFISTRTYTRAGLPSNAYQYYSNNRVVAFHLGFEGSIHEWDFIIKTSYSLNYGTYSTIIQFPQTKQFSAYLYVNKELKQGLNIGFTGAFDVGELLYNSVGGLFSVSKIF